MKYKKKILVVDDERGILDMFKTLLDETCEVVLCESGMQAVEELKNGFKADLVFLDIKMSKLDGVETLKSLQKIDHGFNAVMMTGYALEEKVKKAKGMGAVESISKPFEIDSILKIVEKYGRK